jgi:hypothetical protein
MYRLPQQAQSPGAKTSSTAAKPRPEAEPVAVGKIAVRGFTERVTVYSISERVVPPPQS